MRPRASVMLAGEAAMTDTPEFEAFSAHGLCWVARAPFAPVLKGDPRVAGPSGGAEVVKKGPARRVWRFRPEGFDGVVYVKENLLPEIADRLKYVLRPAKASHEWKRLLELHRRGVPAPRPLAVGVRRRGPFLETSIILTEEIAAVAPLSRYFQDNLEAASHAEVVEFTARLAAFVRRLHDSGVVHRDLHPANIMVSGPPDEAEFHLLDLYDVRLCDVVPQRTRLRNLAVLGHFFCRTVARHWRARFLKNYLAGGGEYRHAARVVESTAERGMRKIWARRDRRIFRQNKYFRHVRVGNLLGHRRRTDEGRAAAALFASREGFDGASRIIKDSRSSKIGLFTAQTRAGGTTFMVKRRNPRSGWRSLLDPLRASRGKKGFYLGAAFEYRHLPTPRVFAVLDERRRGRLEASYLVLEYVEGAANLGEVLAARENSPLYRRLMDGKGAFCDRLARTLRRMHWCGFSMRDLKAANILLHDDGGRLEHFITDLDGVRQYTGAVPERQAMRNLARLYFDVSWLGGVTRREAMDFLRVYLAGAPREKLARWVSGIAAFVREKRARFKPKGVFADTKDSAGEPAQRAHNA